MIHIIHHKKSPRHHSFGKSPGGFTLIEAVVVLAVLSILAGITIPNVRRIWDFNAIDEAKALVNTAAADCLQKSRLNDANKGSIDGEIISDPRLESLGFSISKDSNSCDTFEIIPTDENDNIRYPFGFSLLEGKLTKFGSPESDDAASISSCKNWAGKNCTQDSSLKELIAYKKTIAEAKAICDANYSNWLKGGTDPSAFKKWDSSATRDCPSKPPKVVSPTCTPNGCTQTVYGFEGRDVGSSPDDYTKALEAKYGRVCTEWVSTKSSEKYTNDPANQAQTLKECGTKEYWFYKGDDVGQEEFNKRKCEEKIAENINSVKITQLEFCGTKTYYFCGGKDQLSEDQYNKCLADNQEAKCIADREKARTENYKGKYGPIAGPGACGEIKWLCNGTMVETEQAYNATNCGVKQCPGMPNDACQESRMYRHPVCFAWARCKGYI